MSLLFDRDPAKALRNERKHGVRFEIARRVFADPFVLVEQDRAEGGEFRWQAIGDAGGLAVMIVAHTYVDGEDKIIRIISARYATPGERRNYGRHVRAQQL
ncbi:BrnT family toxin [uncultured Sphingomonas sp.]|uniref:BrnT family toxin n=1 Tax=uncultured Sphingomonas sp. TaxID=158754 RepID=UPI0035CC565F